jgi:hypothetical protein
MTESKYHHSISSIYDNVIDNLNEELRRNGYRIITLRKFKQIVKHYFKHMFNRCIYKYQTVELYEKMGTLTGHKILCTEFNPKGVDVNKTDGYFYYIFWLRPAKYLRWAFTLAPIWKKRQFQNVRDNQGDYPEFDCLSYGICN